MVLIICLIFRLWGKLLLLIGLRTIFVNFTVTVTVSKVRENDDDDASLQKGNGYIAKFVTQK